MTEPKKEQENIPDERSALEKLNAGLLTQYFHRQIDEAAYAVLDRITFGHQVLQDRHSYGGEVQRVITELKITASLVKNINEESELEIDGKTIHSEELITYYVGIFFGLVHQAKDKLLRLIDLMAAADDLKKPYEGVKKMKPSHLLKKHDEIIDGIGVRELVSEWKDDGAGSITVILRKRTQHEHFKSTVQLDKDFQNIRSARTVLGPALSANLNAEGVAYMKKLASESFVKYKADVVSKQADALSVIQENINQVAEKLIAYFQVPESYEEQARLTNEWLDHQKSMEVVNKASLNKFADTKVVTLDSLKDLANSFGEEMISTYGVGSVFRDEFVGGTSDINLIVITKTVELEKDSEMPVTIKLIPQDKFLDEDHKKDRFIIYSDGTLIAGVEQKLKSSDFPKPGAELAHLLNKDSIGKLEEIQKDVETNGFVNNIEARLIQIKAVKIMMDQVFGVAISNKPFYTASRQEKFKYINIVFKDQNFMTPMIAMYYVKRMILSKDEFLKLLELMLVQSRKNFQKISDIVNR